MLCGNDVKLGQVYMYITHVFVGALTIILFLYVVDVVMQCKLLQKRFRMWENGYNTGIFPHTKSFLHHALCYNLHNTKKLFYCNRDCTYVCT